MSKYEIYYKAGGDNPSHYEVEQCRKDICNNYCEPFIGNLPLHLKDN